METKHRRSCYWNTTRIRTFETSRTLLLFITQQNLVHWNVFKCYWNQMYGTDFNFFCNFYFHPKRMKHSISHFVEVWGPSKIWILFMCIRVAQSQLQSAQTLHQSRELRHSQEQPQSLGQAQSLACKHMHQHWQFQQSKGPVMVTVTVIVTSYSRSRTRLMEAVAAYLTVAITIAFTVVGRS